MIATNLRPDLEPDSELYLQYIFTARKPNAVGMTNTLTNGYMGHCLYLRVTGPRQELHVVHSLRLAADGQGHTNGHFVSALGSHTPANSRYLGPAQRRYGDYFLNVLASPNLAQPDNLTKVLRQVTDTMRTI